MSHEDSEDATQTARPTNRLGRETSAYLRQHQHNPVDWYPWGDEALDRARECDRPLLVSIGYSACHWCHVMERECFENPAIAGLMNEAFVNIKVDREERPDVDQIYMDASLRLNGHGGWPLNAICTPEGRPFFVGTYFPPERRGNTPGFPEIIAALTRAWREERREVEENAGQIADALVARPTRPEQASSKTFGVETVRSAAALIMRNADHAHGGFGSAPKFPTPTNLEFLSTALDFLDSKDATQVARFLMQCAREMSRRGLYDQLGGGFHRYCVDANWTIPHFEKMLYDQGQLLSFYAELARRSHDAHELEWPVRETVEYLRREMRAANGAFHASQDADSEGVEGKFFVWTPEEIDAVLGDESKSFCSAYGVRAKGNFEGVASHLIDEARGPRSEFESARVKLRARRAERIAPALDPKHVAAWNGYTISGLARAASNWADPAMLEDAVGTADFVLGSMVDEKKKLQRVHNEGCSHTSGFLDDHAAMLNACLDLHRAGAGDRFLASAVGFADDIVSRFADRDSGALYLTDRESQRLIHRPRSEHDGATPDASGLAILGLTRLAAISGSSELDAFVDLAIAEEAVVLERSPHAFPTLLRAIALRIRGLSVAVIVGDASDSNTQALAERARRVLRPEDAVLVVTPDSSSGTASAGAAPSILGVGADWLAGREAIDGRATAYVCVGTSCSLPIHEPTELVADLLPHA
ncbi:MAG: thioredoxin domain-containing protein [Proteobacteria bacterium]|nr:thioredoxin domain-containing protein [Pseudomonadota bacterium]